MDSATRVSGASVVDFMAFSLLVLSAREVRLASRRIIEYPQSECFSSAPPLGNYRQAILQPQGDHRQWHDASARRQTEPPALGHARQNENTLHPGEALAYAEARARP